MGSRLCQVTEEIANGAQREFRPPGCQVVDLTPKSVDSEGRVSRVVGRVRLETSFLRPQFLHSGCRAGW